MPVEPFQHEADREPLAAVLTQTFSLAPGYALTWFEKFGEANLRLIRVDGDIAGALGLVPMGQWYGGRVVPLVGIAGVGIAPHHRGRGVGAALMRGVMRELREKGVALSALYPATQTLYRVAGYESAGTKFDIRLPLPSIERFEADGEIRALPASQREIAETVYRQQASRSHGHLERGPYVWGRVWELRGEAACVQGVFFDGRCEGYAGLIQRRTGSMNFQLDATDVVALTPRAARRLLRLFSDYSSICPAITWGGAPTDPLLAQLSEPRAEIKLFLSWMLRIVDLPAAIAARGYAAAVDVEAHLDVRDDVLPQNHGRWVLRVRGGRATAEPGGRGSVRIDIRGLAPLYSSHLSAYEVRTIGLLEGSDTDLASLTTAFAAPSPWMPDMF